jgi:hypothetical protein
MKGIVESIRNCDDVRIPLTLPLSEQQILKTLIRILTFQKMERRLVRE